MNNLLEAKEIAIRGVNCIDDPLLRGAAVALFNIAEFNVPAHAQALSTYCRENNLEPKDLKTLLENDPAAVQTIYEATNIAHRWLGIPSLSLDEFTTGMGFIFFDTESRYQLDILRIPTPQAEGR